MNDDIRATAGELNRDRPANPAGCAGDNRDLIGKLRGVHKLGYDSF
jgi:hypothetical protein